MRRSAIAFSVFLVLTMISISFELLPKQLSMGVLWTGTGLLMMFLPPVFRVPKAWIFCVAGFIGLSLVGFLPRECFSVSPWRLEVEAAGGETGSTSFVQPLLAAEGAAGFIIMALTALYIMGHFIQSRFQQWLLLIFCVFMAIWVIIAMVTHKEGEVFGFFLNRNHTATLLAMTVFVGIGALAQAIRHRHMVLVALHTPCILLTLWAIFAVSISRAGILLTALGLILWFVVTGVGFLRSNAGKMLILLVIAIAGTYLIVDSAAKSRLTETVEAWSDASNSDSDLPPEKTLSNDPRYLIYKDTLSMIRSEPWTGVGPLNFEFVFPQHMDFCNFGGEKYFIHPESDWLQMITQVGLPSVICLIIGIFFAVIYSFRSRKIGKGRFLRNGSLVAAVLLLLHGMIDMPGHKAGIALAGILFLTLSMQGVSSVEKSGWRKGTLLDRAFWRSMGFAILILGACCMVNQASSKAFLPTAKILKLYIEGQRLEDLYLKARAAADANGIDQRSPAAEQAMEAAIAHYIEASKISPLDAYLRHDIGYCAAITQNDLFKKHFSLHLLLNPRSYHACYDQAILWGDVKEIIPLAKMAIERAARADSHFAHRNNTKLAFTFFLDHSWKFPTETDYAKKLLDLAGDDQYLRMLWIKRVAAIELDRHMPEYLETVSRDEDRKALFGIWNTKGSRKIIDEFVAKHPDWQLGAK